MSKVMGQESLEISSKFDISNRNAIVTGGSRGIGKSIANMLATNGANVAVCGRNRVSLAKVEEELRGTSISVVASECDVQNHIEVETFVDAVAEEFGRIDLLVNNVGGHEPAAFEEYHEDTWQNIVDLNLNTTRRTTTTVAPHMQECGGDIINISSIRGIRGAPERVPYAASKAAIIRLTQTLAMEWAKHNISVNCVAPGVIYSDSVAETLDIENVDIPPRSDINRRIGYAEEIADVVHFLASPASSFVSGVTIPVTGVPDTTHFGKSSLLMNH